MPGVHLSTTYSQPQRHHGSGQAARSTSHHHERPRVLQPQHPWESTSRIHRYRSCNTYCSGDIVSTQCEVAERAPNPNIQLSPKRRDELLEESFPKIRHQEGGIKELTTDEYEKLRINLQEIVRAEVNEKMVLLREQLSEYHSVLEDVIAFKSRCEKLEQDKNDLVSLCREVCQVRDDKIALLEKELSRLKNDLGNCRNSISSSSGGSDWDSLIISGGSEGQFGHGHRPQRNHLHPTPPLPPTQTTLSRMNNHPHPYYSNDSRRITIGSPPSPSSSISQSSIQTRL
eukprot:scaffold2937_cov137-Skeletonema_menzelii.AAC.4